MVNFSEILSAYPPTVQVHREFVLREYLQYKLLEILFESRYAGQFCFLGDTCIRLVHGSQRFSEDLDFDNLGITGGEFQEVAALIKKGLEREGYQVEIRQVIRSTFHCYIRFPGLLFEHGLSGYKEEKILIQLDTEPQHFDYAPESFVLNKFDVTTRVLVTPPALLLAQKFAALCLRKRTKGRDFYDIAFLLSKSVTPDYAYLAQRLDAPDAGRLRERVDFLLSKTDLNDMVNDVKAFLINPADEKRIRLFPDILRQADLG
jgi:predicted nucleotidyltransferase component of viral defense system